MVPTGSADQFCMHPEILEYAEDFITNAITTKNLDAFALIHCIICFVQVDEDLVGRPLLTEGHLLR